jgi:hypothetical protein
MIKIHKIDLFNEKKIYKDIIKNFSIKQNLNVFFFKTL